MEVKANWYTARASNVATAFGTGIISCTSSHGWSFRVSTTNAQLQPASEPLPYQSRVSSDRTAGRLGRWGVGGARRRVHVSYRADFSI